MTHHNPERAARQAKAMRDALAAEDAARPGARNHSPSPAGWYPNPEPSGEGMRYWDGESWTTAPAWRPREPTSSGNNGTLLIVSGVAALLLPIVGFVGAGVLARRKDWVSAVVLALWSLAIAFGGFLVLTNSDPFDKPRAPTRDRVVSEKPSDLEVCQATYDAAGVVLSPSLDGGRLDAFTVRQLRDAGDTLAQGAMVVGDDDASSAMRRLADIAFDAEVGKPLKYAYPAYQRWDLACRTADR